MPEGRIEQAPKVGQSKYERFQYEYPTQELTGNAYIHLQIPSSIILDTDMDTLLFLQFAEDWIISWFFR